MLHAFYDRTNVLTQPTILLEGMLLSHLDRLTAGNDLAVRLLLQVRHVAQDHAVHVEQEIHPLLESDQTQLASVLKGYENGSYKIIYLKGDFARN